MAIVNPNHESDDDDPGLLHWNTGQQYNFADNPFYDAATGRGKGQTMHGNREGGAGGTATPPANQPGHDEHDQMDGLQNASPAVVEEQQHSGNFPVNRLNVVQRVVGS